MDEVDSFLEFEGVTFRVQLSKAFSLFEKYQGLFIFYHTPSHKKHPDDALNADRMNVKDGEKQPYC